MRKGTVRLVNLTRCHVHLSAIQQKLLFVMELSAIKMLTGFGSEAYGNKPLGSCDDIHQVKSWFTNPYTNEKVLVVICPSNQVKAYNWWKRLGVFVHFFYHVYSPDFVVIGHVKEHITSLH